MCTKIKEGSIGKTKGFVTVVVNFPKIKYVVGNEGHLNSLHPERVTRNLSLKLTFVVLWMLAWCIQNVTLQLCPADIYMFMCE